MRKLGVLCALAFLSNIANASGQNVPITDCDRLAAAPVDPQRKTSGATADKVDPDTAIPACETAVRQYPNVARLTFQLGRAYFASKAFQEAIDQYRKAAERGYRPAQNNLGAMYQSGLGVAKDDAQAVAWFREAAEQGYAPAQTSLGAMYRDGRGVTQDDSQAVSWYRKAAERGYAPAQNNLGVMYQSGLGVANDDTQAVAWYRRAADQKIAEAQNNLGNMYANGRGVRQGDSQALDWYRKAADQGYTPAQTVLGMMYETRSDYHQAVIWFCKAADQGYAPAQTSLADLYDQGQGVTFDLREAMMLYRKAAEQGYAPAQLSLGAMYENGRGVTQDYRQALSWYRKAAEQGNETAKGKIVDIAPRVAELDAIELRKGQRAEFEQVKQRAEQGDALAQYNLGAMFDAGQGVREDYLRAHMWMNLAASKLAGEEARNAATNRDRTAKNLTPDQVIQAQEMARKCEAQSFKDCD